MGFEVRILIINFGSLGIFCLLLPFFYIFYFITTFCQGFKCCRKTKKWLNNKIYWSVTMRLIIESHIIGLICCLIALSVVDFNNDAKFTYINSILTVFFLAVFLGFPVFICYYMCKNFDDLG